MAETTFIAVNEWKALRLTSFRLYSVYVREGLQGAAMNWSLTKMTDSL